MTALPLCGEVRIVSGAPNLTEILVRLGHGHSLVGVSDFCPPGHPRVAGLKVRWESVFALHPTHLFLLPTQAERPGLNAAGRLGVKVLVLDFSRLDSIAPNARLIGAFLGGQGEALPSARAFEADLRALPRIPEARTAYVLWWSPLVTAGPSSFIGEGLARLGLETGPPSEAEFPTVPAEALLAWSPALVLYPSDAGPPPAWLQSGHGIRFKEVPADRWNRPSLDFPAALKDLGDALTR